MIRGSISHKKNLPAISAASAGTACLLIVLLKQALRRRRVSLLLFLLFISSLLLWHPPETRCEEEKKPLVEEVSADISTGYHHYNATGYRGKAGEYEVLDTGSEVNFMVEGRRDNTYLRITGEALDQNDQSYAAKLDVRRILQTDFSYQRFQHALDHDPLTNQDSVRDYNIGRDARIVLEELKADNTIKIPALPFVKFNLDVRSYTKQGHRQALTVGKCSQCHITSRNRRVDSSTNDITAGVEASLGPATLTYSQLQRTFNEHAAAPLANYGDGASFFLVRGTAPYSLVPDSTMNVQMLNLRSKLPVSSFLFLSYQHGQRRNTDTHKDVTFNSIAGRLSKYFSQYFTCDLFYSRYSMDAEARRGIERDVERGGLEVNLRPLKQAGLSCLYQWEDIDRENVAENSTGKNIYRVSYNQRILKKLRLNVKYQKTKVDDPFVMKDQTFSRLVQTSLPRQEDETYTSLNWTPRHNLTCTANLRFSNSRNSRYDVDEEMWEFVLSFWYVPIERLTLSGAYTRADNTVDTGGSLKTYHLNGAESLFRYDDIPYDSRSQSWFLSATYRLTPRIFLSGEVTCIDSIADFDKKINARNIGEFSDLAIDQLETSLGMTYSYSKQLSMHAKYMYRKYDDRERNYFDGAFSLISVGLNWSF